MKARSTLRALAAVALIAPLAIPSPANARSFRLRGAVQTEDAVVQGFEKGSDKVRVIIVAKESRATARVQSFAASPTAARRMAADDSTREIRELLDGPSGGLARVMTVASDYTYLWAANAVAAEVDRETLDRFQQMPSVGRIVLDREVDWLSIDQVPPPRVRQSAERPENYGLGRIEALEAREVHGLDGQGVVVGHIDTGVQESHPALQGKVLAFRDFVDGKQEPYDDQGHGTHSAGSIVADHVGVAPKARLVVAKALNAYGSGTLSGLLDAMQWMLDPDGDPSTDDQPDLVSNSWGADKDALGDGADMFRDIVIAWRQAGIVPVFASGNSGLGSKAVPGGYPEAFAVGATDENDHIAYFSTGGPVEWDGVTYLKPDVSAPGVDILSTLPDGGYERMNGTSMACPHVAGALALLLQANPDLSVDQAQQAFEQGAVDLGDPGRDDRFGEGRIDVMAALQASGARQVAASVASTWLN